MERKRGNCDVLGDTGEERVGRVDAAARVDAIARVEGDAVATTVVLLSKV